MVVHGEYNVSASACAEYETSNVGPQDAGPEDEGDNSFEHNIVARNENIVNDRAVDSEDVNDESNIVRAQQEATIIGLSKEDSDLSNGDERGDGRDLRCSNSAIASPAENDISGNDLYGGPIPPTSSDDMEVVLVGQSASMIVDEGETLVDHNSSVHANSFKNEVTAEASQVEQGCVCGRGWLFEKGSRALFVVFPKLEPLPWTTFFILSFFAALPVAGYLIVFTKMGFGMDTMYYLSAEFSEYTPVVFAGLVGTFFALYLFDAESWTSKLGRICQIGGIGLIVGAIFLLILFLAGDYPYGPICVFTIFVPIWMVLMKLIFYKSTDPRVYVSWLAGPLFFVSVLTALLWIGWTFINEQNEWNQLMRLHDVETVGCEPNYEEYPECQTEDGDVCFHTTETAVVYEEGCADHCVKVYGHCLNTFILWVGPLLVAICLFFLSFFCTFLRSESQDKDLINFAKLWIFLLLAMWVGASMAGAGSGIIFALTALTLAAFVGSGVLLSISFNQLSQTQRGANAIKRLAEKYGAYMDAAKGLLVVTCAPVALAYLALSFVNQCIRRSRFFPCTVRVPKSSEVDEITPGSQWVTEKAARQVNEFKSWDLSKIYTYAVYWGIAFMTMQVIVAQFTLVLMSWLIEITMPMPLWKVTLIMFGVGLFMFLLPPVPGVPIYLTLGVVTVATGRELLGVIGSMIYCAFVSLLLKLFACALQQKLIGETLSKYVYIRQLVGINSTAIRSMKLILSEQGLGIPKVAILIGGPDWPTSVLCGIMRLGLFQILLGTTPIIFLIFPTMLTGSLAYLSSLKVDGMPEFPWAGTLGTISAAVTAVVQFGAMLIAAYYLERTASLSEEELANMPYDEEVKRADDKAEYQNLFYGEVTKWQSVPRWAKTILLSSLGCMVTCCYMVQLFTSRCFRDYELTNTVTEHLDGNVFNLVLPLGWWAIGFFIVSCFLLKIFTSWATRKAKSIMKDRDRASSNELGESAVTANGTNLVSTAIP